MADAVASLVAGGGALGTYEPAMIAGGVSWLLGAPVAHWRRGRIGAGFGSLGMRVAAPLVGVALPLLAVSDAQERERAMLIGAGVASVLVTVADAALNSFETVAEPRALAIGAAPVLGGGELVVGGVF